MDSRPKFLTAFFKNVSESYDRNGVRAIVPWWLFLGLAVGTVVAWYMPESYWWEKKWDIATTVFTGFLAFDGLLLALGWGAFSKIYEILSTGWFAAFLRRHDLLGDHLFFVDAVHAILVLSAVSSGAALVSVLLPLPLWSDRIILAVVVGLSLWSLTKALSAMSMMNDLIWELAHSEPDDRGHLRPVDSGERSR
ncbi:hypothetical protein [Oceanibacterium hippocampi]|uniref:hypothetical protein n=1 Tax=Oceanibacterium hippocampi TaxID=745714 RepID=UPI00111C7B6A|nr:hypothetical protein [Oceanibacterium hippocampi]